MMVRTTRLMAVDGTLILMGRYQVYRNDFQLRKIILDNQTSKFHNFYSLKWYWLQQLLLVDERTFEIIYK